MRERMDWDTLEHTFLQAELERAAHKLEQLEQARRTSDDSLEAAGLEARRHTAQLEYDLVCTLLHHEAPDDLTLDALILQHIKRLSQTVSRLAQNWRRGQGIPPGYWDAQNQLAFLTDLQRRYHAWRDGAPPEPDDPAFYVEPSPGNPWVDEDEERPVIKPDEVQRAIRRALAAAGFEQDHLHVIVEPDGTVILTGYAHNEASHEQAIRVVLNVDGVSEVVSDIKTAAAQDCPICRSRENRDRDP